MSSKPFLSSIFLAALVGSASSAVFFSLAGQDGAAAQQNGATGAVLPTRSQVLDVLQSGLSTEERQVIASIAIAEPAVASVIARKDLPVYERSFETIPLPDAFGEPFEFRVPRLEQQGTELREVGGGTAFFVGADGLLLTNKHVISDPEARYSVILNDGRTLAAEVVAMHPGNDIALLQVEGSGFATLMLSAEDPQLGQTAIAIGNALGEYSNTVSVGVVSGLRRSLVAGTGFGGPVERLDRILQTDAAINRGNSGGPLLGSNGTVIGMNTAMALGAENIGFAIPAADLRRAIESYRELGRITQAYLGVRYIHITPDLAAANDLPVEEGALVIRGETIADAAVLSGSPAAEAGIEEGDILLEADGERLTVNRTLSSIVQGKDPGESIRLRLLRDGEEQELMVTLGELPGEGDG